MSRIGALLWCLILCGPIDARSAGVQGGRPGEARGGGITELVGNWSGESVCVDKEKFPACNDERVVYRVAVAPGKSDTVTITMDKIVDGRPETMATLDFAYDAQKHTLSGEFTRNNRRGIWEFVVKGDSLEGTLSTLPERALVRRIKVKKDE